MCCGALTMIFVPMFSPALNIECTTYADVNQPLSPVDTACIVAYGLRYARVVT